MTRVRVVIPSLIGDPEQLAGLCRSALQAGASPVVVANSKGLCQKLSSTSVPHLTSGVNEGFTGSIYLGAQGAWDWLVILNDDLGFEPLDLASCLSAETLGAFDLLTIVQLDNEPARKIPTRIGVVLSVSLLSNIGRRLTPKSCGTRHLDDPNSYRPFSAVAIGRDAWDRVGGLDTRYPFAYEDADFVRRSRELGVKMAVVQSRIVHLHSQTGRRFVGAVLPVATWSALEYLTKWYGKRTLNRWLLLIALTVRAPIALATLPWPRKQIQAVLEAAKALAINEKPTLPEWKDV